MRLVKLSEIGDRINENQLSFFNRDEKKTMKISKLPQLNSPLMT